MGNMTSLRYGRRPERAMRLGLLRVTSTAGVGCVAFLLICVALYCLSVLFWGFWLMLAMGAWGPYHWSYLYVITHWGLLAPFVLG